MQTTPRADQGTILVAAALATTASCLMITANCISCDGSNSSITNTRHDKPAVSTKQLKDTKEKDTDCATSAELVLIAKDEHPDRHRLKTVTVQRVHAPRLDQSEPKNGLVVGRLDNQVASSSGGMKWSSQLIEETIPLLGRQRSGIGDSGNPNHIERIRDQIHQQVDSF